ncbi:hypothetical protein CB1_001602009 [Camelus ferus]|nr:hypothetical protein CB1_001602009 [Camelus ferus]
MDRISCTLQKGSRQGYRSQGLQTAVAKVVPPPQCDFNDVTPLLRELTQDPVLQAFQPPESAGGDELVLKALQSGQAVVHPLSPNHSQLRGRVSRLRSLAGTTEPLEVKQVGSDFCAGTGDPLE